jgi:cell division protein ZapE
MNKNNLEKIDSSLFNEKQTEIKIFLDELIAYFNKNFYQKILSFFQAYPQSVYLYGSVGAGKSVLMSYFYNRLNISNKIFIHYQDFMLMIHKMVVEVKKNTDSVRVMNVVAKILSSKYKVMCIDEFEVVDIADAMLLKTLLNKLDEYNIFIFFTSNKHPKDLYKDGLQRQNFLSTIDFIMNNYSIKDLILDIDYRKLYFAKLHENKSILLNPSNEEIDNFNYYIKKLKESNLKSSCIEVFGRKIHFQYFINNSIIVTFEELFHQELGQNDFVTIAKFYDEIILESIKIIDPSDTNVAIRFMNFIDQMYMNNKKLITIIPFDINLIYKGKKKEKEFERVISRITEMSSMRYK